MSDRDWFSKALAIVGTALVWLPVIATLATSRIGGPAGFRLDWLAPAELFPAVVVGGVALLWAALRARTRFALVAWGLGVVIVGLVAMMVIPMATGLASGATQPEDAPLATVATLVFLGVYSAAMIELGVAGVLMILDLFRRGHEPKHAAPAEPAG